jgi:adenosylcobinamide-GDP ribazoletransferase
MKRFAAALQFLTVLPVSCRCDERELGRSALLFPVIGLLIGGGIVLLNHALSAVLPPLVVNVLLVVAMLAISGGLHMDGLADTADGFLSSRPRERILEIMKDSRTGAMGVIAVVCVLGLKMAALVSMPSHLRWPTLLLMPLAGRCALVIEMAALPYARPEGGLGAVFASNKSAIDPFLAVAVMAAAGYCAMGRLGLISAGAAVALTLAFSFWCRRKIGGFTGDTLGAACELAELAPALVVVARIQ